MLAKGSKGLEVSKVQNWLVHTGLYSGPVNGIYDNRTMEAVMKFQQLHGLGIDGVVGPITMARFIEILNSKPKDLPLKGRLLIVDAGHGQDNISGQGDPGAVDPANLIEGDKIITREDDLVFLYAQEYAVGARALGAEVVLTRTTDKFVSLGERVRIANQYPDGDLFVSFHADSATPKAMGASALVYRNTGIAGRVAANSVTELRKAGYPIHGTGIFERPGLAVLKGAKMPSVLYEMGFVTNPLEEARMHDKAYRKGQIEALLRAHIAEFGRK